MSTSVAIRASETPIAFETNGTVRDARGFASNTQIRSSFTASCRFSTPRTPESARQPARDVLDLVELVVGERGRRDLARRVARVHARLLDVLHHRADEHVGAVGHRVDVDLDRAFQEPVDQHRVIGRCLGRGADERLQVVGVVDDLHRAAAQHVRRADDHREPDLRRDRPRLRQRPRLTVRRRRDVELGEDLRELPAVLGQIDRLGRGAQHREALLLERAREPQRRLAAELDDHAHRPFRVTDGQDVLGRHRLEVQAAGRVVVGRHGLGVAVDHDRLEPGLLQRERRVHARVVELDPLSDPVRPGAQDQHAWPGRRPDLGLVLVRRVVVRRARRELSGARVDRLEDGRDAERLAVTPNGRVGRRVSDRRSADRRDPAVSPLAARRRPTSTAVGRGAASRLRPPVRSGRRTTDRSTTRSATSSTGVAGEERRLHRARAGPPWRSRPPPAGIGAANDARSTAGPSPAPRHALPSASLNVRPIAITSPTDFIVDVSSGSAPGNFSNANRGIFTTT